MPTSIPSHDPTDPALPYNDDEIEYQDHNSNPPTASRPSSFFSFLSTDSSSRPTHMTDSSAKKRLSLNFNISNTIANPEKSKHLLDSLNDDEEHNNDSFEEYEHEYETEKRPYPKPFYRRKKFWGICLVSTCIFLAIFIPLLLIVIIPKVAQLIMNSSTMTILQMNMTHPQETSIQVSVDAAILGIPSLFAATVEFQAPVQVYWIRTASAGGGVPTTADSQPKVGTMQLGSIKKKAFSKAEFSQQTTFQIMDPVLFGEFAKVMMASESFLWRITADIDVSVIGRTIKGLSLDKSLNLAGLNNFSDLKILAFDIPSDAPDGTGALAAIKVSIPNPSPIGMSLGTLTIDMFLKTAYLGRIVAKNAVLTGGQPTILELQGTILKQNTTQSLQELSSMISNYLANTPSTAYGQGVSVLPDGVNAVSWMTTAIVSTKMSIPLLPPTPMEFIKEIDIANLNLKMTPDQPWVPMASSSSIAAVFQLPFNISMNITNLENAVMTLTYDNTPVADITTAVWNRTNSDMAHNNISFSLPMSPLPVRANAHDEFEKFLITVAQQKMATFDIIGSAQSTAVTSLGQVNITVPFNTSLTLPGIDFKSMQPVLSNILVVGGNKDYVTINATVIINNPSIFAVDAGPARLHVQATIDNETMYIGDVLLSNLKLNPGQNPLAAQVHIQPTNTTFRDAFFTEYIIGTNFAATIYGDSTSSSIVSLAPIMESLKMVTVVPGMNPPARMVAGGNGNTTVGQFMNDHQIMLQVQIQNPVATELWVQTFQANVFWKGFPFGAINIANQPFSLAASVISSSPYLAIQIPSSYQFWTFMITTFLPQNLGVLTGAYVYVDIQAQIAATIGGNIGVGYAANIKYNQDQVGVFLKIEFSLTGLGLGKRRAMKRSQSDGEYESESGFEEADALGPEPAKENSREYLAWLQRAVDWSYPEEAAAAAKAA
ncbi:hypothetical protein BGZ83_009462 [Gryganskiella cystojenkinii]|nr:hypothetical protein BGZ83_009462 [Gryganskiella cystojenkinii]